MPLLLSGWSEERKAKQDSLKLPSFAGLQCPRAGGTVGPVSPEWVCGGRQFARWGLLKGLVFFLLPLALSLAVEMVAWGLREGRRSVLFTRAPLGFYSPAMKAFGVMRGGKEDRQTDGQSVKFRDSAGIVSKRVAVGCLGPRDALPAFAVICLL